MPKTVLVGDAAVVGRRIDLRGHRVPPSIDAPGRHDVLRWRRAAVASGSGRRTSSLPALYFAVGAGPAARRAGDRRQLARTGPADPPLWTSMAVHRRREPRGGRRGAGSRCSASSSPRRGALRRAGLRERARSGAARVRRPALLRRPVHDQAHELGRHRHRRRRGRRTRDWLSLIADGGRAALLTVLNLGLLLAIPVFWGVRGAPGTVSRPTSSASVPSRPAGSPSWTAPPPSPAKRARMARDLHDVIAGQLSAIAIQSEAALNLDRPRPGDAAPRAHAGASRQRRVAHRDARDDRPAARGRRRRRRPAHVPGRARPARHAAGRRPGLRAAHRGGRPASRRRPTSRPRSTSPPTASCRSR